MKVNRKKVEIILFAVIAITTMLSMKAIDNTNKVEETMATPATGKVVILDAGHGGEDGGAISSDGTTEAELNLQITLKVQQLLEQCFYKNKNEQSEKLAKCLQEGLNASIQKENNRLAMKINDIYIVKNVEIPLSIVECGFLSNPQEREELKQNEYQNRLAWGIYTGICEYFKQ